MYFQCEGNDRVNLPDIKQEVTCPADSYNIPSSSFTASCVLHGLIDVGLTRRRGTPTLGLGRTCY